MSISGDYYESIAILEEAPQSDYASLQVISTPGRARVISEPVSPLEQALLRATRTRGPEGERGGARLELDRPVRFRTLERPESVVGSIRNLSTQGAYIRSSKLAVRPGAMVAFGCYVYHRGRRRVLRSMGRVVWVDGHGIERRGFGLRFVEPPPEMVRIINEMLQDQRRGGLIS